jgi:hypothetical protein
VGHGSGQLEGGYPFEGNGRGRGLFEDLSLSVPPLDKLSSVNPIR